MLLPVHCTTLTRLALLAAVTAATTAFAEQPFSFDTAFGRLPKDVVPVSYEIAVIPDIAAMTISGEEIVHLQFRSAAARIQFNSLHQTLAGVTLDGRPVAGVESDDGAQLTTVTLPAPVAAGAHVLRFAFTGKLEDQPQGMFLQKYVDPAGQAGMMLTTQMESIQARRMFPCWDEPAFRARFTLAITADAAWTAVGNMPVASRTVHGRLATTRFAPTPKMPSYLVELTVGDIAAVRARAGGTDFGVWAVRGQQQYGRSALGNAQQILADYNDYFGIRYPIPKLDSIAIPGGFSGAMENWGAITYNEELLLATPRSTVGDRQEIYSVQAHEMAHQWFGDLVTMGWWDNIWLNESFASWMAARQTDRRNPQWHWWLGQDEDKEGAMAADAIASAHAIQTHVADEQLADNAFDPQITYSKGQAILRMFEAWMGPAAFRDGVRRYVKARAYSNATGADLWNALAAASGHDVGAVARDWTERPGFPLVSVVASCDARGARTLALSQSRFLADGTRTAASDWNIPLQLRAGAGGQPRSVLLRAPLEAEPAGRCDEPLSLNADAIGYFRVAYDADTLAGNTRHFGTLPVGDQLALLDDQWALASAGRAPLPSYLALVDAMGPDLVPRAWLQIASSLEVVEQAERGTPGHQAYLAYARSLLAPVFGRLGMEPQPGETPDLRRLRRQLFVDLGNWGDPAVLVEARRRFTAFLADHNAVAPDDQSAMLAVVAHFADAPTFEQLHALAKGARDAAELPRFYAALAQVVDPALARQVVDIAVGDELPPQANTLPMQLVFQLADHHPQLSWQAFTTHADKLLASDPMSAPLITAQYAPQRYWSGVPLAEIESYARAHVPGSMVPVVERGMETARLRLRRKDTLSREADAYLKR